MPSTTKSKLWFIRITAPHELLKTKLPDLKGWIDLEKMAIGYHIGTKTKKEHIHIALELKTELQQQSINLRMKKLFGVERSDYASKIWDGSLKAISYLYHDEKGEVEFYKMELTPEQITEVQGTVQIYKEITTNAKLKAANRMPDKIIEEIKASGEKWGIRKVLKRIIDGIESNEWYPPGPMMERYIQEIMIKTDPEFKQSLEDYYYDKLRWML